jgi:septum formation protein
MSYQLVLASESPRRKQLLENAGFKFRVFPSKISEILKKNLNVEEQILDLARQKATTVFEALKSSEKEPFLVLGSDTEVYFGGKFLGKPANPDDAFRVLRSLSGNVHTVITAIWMIESLSGQGSGDYELSKVKFKNLSDEQIWSYIQTGDPLDKAGSYGIQGPGRDLIDTFEGTLENIMGLPVHRVKALLEKNSWKVK